MKYEPPSQRKPEKPRENLPESDLDRVRDYSRQFEGEYLQGECFPDREDPADFWKKN
jgi:hypothetical protein